jgi:multiple sugar transport system substrate-binding protein
VQHTHRLGGLAIGATLLAVLPAITALPSASAQDAQIIQENGASATIHMDVLGYDTGVPAWANKTMSGFDASHSGLKLQITVVAPDQLDQLLTTQVEGGDPPDISSLATAWMPAFVQANALVNLRTVLPASFLATFNKTLLSGQVYNGILGTLPYGSTARALFYNKTEFSKAGITSPPATWPQLVSDAAKIQSSHVAPYGFALQGTGSETFAAWFSYLYWSYGGDFGSGAKLQIQNGACVAGLTQLNDLVNVKKATEPDPTTYNITQQEDAFDSGRAAMTITGPWLNGLATGHVNFGVAPIPAGTTSTTLGVADGWGVFTKAKASPSQIKQVLEYIMSPPVENPFVEGRGFLPTIQASFSLPAFNTATVAPFVKLLSKAKFAPLSAKWTTLNDQGGKDLQGLYVNGTSPKQVCSALEGITSSS